MSSEPLALVVAVKALDGLSMRMAAIAQNVANAGNPRFQSVVVNFENALGAAAGRGTDAVEHMPITFQAGKVFGESDDRRLDLELADAARTAGRYAALTDMIGQRMALASLAIGGSR